MHDAIGGCACVLASATAPPLQQYIEERLAEGTVEDCVYDGVEGTGDVPEPEECPEQQRPRVVTPVAHPHRQVDAEERRPADEEDDEHGAEYPDGLALVTHRVECRTLLVLALGDQYSGHSQGGAVFLHKRPEPIVSGVYRWGISCRSGYRRRPRLWVVAGNLPTVGET